MSQVPMPVQPGADILASYPLIAQLFSRHGYAQLDADAVGVTRRQFFNRAILIGEMTKCPVYVVHLSTRGGLERIKAAQARGQRVWKTQPVGGSAALGMSPSRRMRSRCRFFASSSGFFVSSVMCSWQVGGKVAPV